MKIQHNLKQQTYRAIARDGTCIGIGATENAAKEDADRHMTGYPVLTLENKGSPTWSLASDERYWKHAKEVQ